MQNIISKLTEYEGKIIIIGINAGSYQAAFESRVRVEIDGDDMIIGDDDDHCVRIKNYKTWGVIDDESDMTLYNPDNHDEIILCVS